MTTEVLKVMCLPKERLNDAELFCVFHQFDRQVKSMKVSLDKSFTCVELNTYVYTATEKT